MKNIKTNTLVKISVLAGIAFILQLLDFPLPIFPDFLKMDISDLPALFGAFALGPMAGIIVELIKNILHAVAKPTTLGIGEMANFIVGGTFIFIAGLVYDLKKNRKHAAYGVIIGAIAMVIVAAIGNYFVFLPLYEKVLGYPMSAIIGAAAKVNPGIKDVNSYIVFSIVPFNILKAVIVSVITFLSYKRLSPVLHK